MVSDKESRGRESLYRFFRRMGSYIPDERDRGLLVGLTVFDCAYRFEYGEAPPVRRSGTRSLDEMRLIYSSLDTVLRQIEAEREDPSAIYRVLHAQEQQFDAEVHDGRVRQSHDHGMSYQKSQLLEYIAAAIFSSGTPKDRLIRCGISAYDLAIRTGELSRFKAHEIAERDFRTIANGFGARRKPR